LAPQIPAPSLICALPYVGPAEAICAIQSIDAEAAYNLSATTLNSLGLACAVAAAARLLHHLGFEPADRPWERALLLLCICLVGVESAQELFLHTTNAQSQTSLPLLMIVFAMAFARGNARLLRLANEFTDMLAATLRQRESELADAHRRETELVRRDTLAIERRRLMLDMHDGVVGQLVGIQHAARANTLTGAQVADGVAAVIDELRLVIDSLDQAGTNFSNALASFRMRIEPRLEAIGIESRWRNDLPLDQATCDPGVVVHALRILQEALTNAIKYARTGSIEVTCKLDAESPQRILLTIRDHGAGISGDAPAGRGLGNMQDRARAVGATLVISSADPGTALTLGFMRA
jgi:two-component system, NarL family, sensor histidine kinase UhpB